MIKPTPNKNSRKKKLKQQHLSLSKQAVVKQKLLSAKADTCTLPGYTDIFFKGYIQMKIPISFNDNSDKKNTLYNLPATGMAFQREIIKVNEQPLIQGNKNAMDANNIVWICWDIQDFSECYFVLNDKLKNDEKNNMENRQLSFTFPLALNCVFLLT